MSMHEDLARAATAHQWWRKAEALRLADYIRDGLKDAPAEARLVVRNGVRPDGTPSLWFLVEGHTVGIEIHDGGFDASHPCPPRCD